eukprot:6645274-Pyramimonas_sp.AAC.1
MVSRPPPPGGGPATWGSTSPAGDARPEPRGPAERPSAAPRAGTSAGTHVFLRSIVTQVVWRSKTPELQARTVTECTARPGPS